MTPEGRVKEQVKKRLAFYNIVLWNKHEQHPDPWGVYWMPVQGQYAVHGPHDFHGCVQGIYWSIETKAPDNPEDATGPQEDFRVALTRVGGISIVGARGPEAVDKLAELLAQRLGGAK